MAQVKVYYDREGNTLTVWFGNPADEYVVEETGEEIVLMKDREGKVIGFEKLNFTGHVGDAIKVAFETKVPANPLLSCFRFSKDTDGISGVSLFNAFDPSLPYSS